MELSFLPSLSLTVLHRELVRLAAASSWVETSKVVSAPRNKDFQEVTLESEGRVLLHFAAAYGFRNIQNLVQKLKRGRCPYHYVEVMACPAGIHGRPTAQLVLGPFWDQCCGTGP